MAKRKAQEIDSSEGEEGLHREEDLEAEDPPSSINPYAVLELEKSASADQVKTAYRKMALKYHPDKVSAEEKDSAHTKFQEIAFAYAILSDPQRRKRYDTTGRTNDSFEDDDDFDWADFFRAQFEEVVSSDSIEKFKKEYQGSDEEKMDVIAAYVDFEGDLDGLFSTVMLSNPLDDEKRFRAWIDEEIAAGRLEAYSAYAKENAKTRKKRMQEAAREADEAEEYAKELGVHDKLFGGKAKKAGKDDQSSLAALIQQRQKARAGNFLADLEAKYSGKQGAKSGGKRKKQKHDAIPEEPPEEAFERNRAKSSRANGHGGDAANGSTPRRSKKAKV